MSMEVTLDSTKQLPQNNGENALSSGFNAVRNGIGGTFNAIGNTLKGMGETLSNCKVSSWYPYGMYSYVGFPYYVAGGIYPGSIFGCCHHRGFWGIPTGVSHFTPIYSDPMPYIPMSSDNTPPTIFKDNNSEPPVVKLPKDGANIPAHQYLTPIFGASPDFYASMGLNPFEYTTVYNNGFMGNSQFMSNPWSSYSNYFPAQEYGVPNSTMRLTPDMCLHPEKYNLDAKSVPNSPVSTFQSTQQQTPAQKKNEDVVRTVENNCSQFGTQTPDYFNQIKNKIEKGKPVTAEEQRLYDNYVKLTTRNCPFETDENGNIKSNRAHTIHNKIQALSTMLASDDYAMVENFLNKTSPEELAAIDYYWEKIQVKNPSNPNETMPLNPKPLREMIKDSCNWFLCKWTNWNGNASKRLLDTLDRKTVMENPYNMTNALYQYLECHHAWGFGFNEEKVMELLNKLEKNKAFAGAVYAEFVGKYAKNPATMIRKDKLFSSKEICEKAVRIFTPFSS